MDKRWGAIKQVELILRSLNSTDDELNMREVYEQMNKIREKKIDVRKDRGYTEGDLSGLFELLVMARDFLRELKVFVDEWFRENLPDYNYGINLSRDLEGIQIIEDYEG